MPYTIRKKGNKWCLYKKDTGEKVSEHDTREKAISAMRLRYGVEHGMEVRKDKY